MRLLHTILRVGDLQRSIDFYTRVLGMRVLVRAKIPNINTRWHSWAIPKRAKAR